MLTTKERFSSPESLVAKHVKDMGNESAWNKPTGDSGERAKKRKALESVYTQY